MSAVSTRSSRPLVSVLLPAYNSETTVADAIRDVLQQTYEHLELIVVDDGSRDRTPEVIRSFEDRRVKRIELPHNTGIMNARNTAVAAATGELLAAIDHDDRTDHQRLELQVARFLDEPRLGALGTAATIVVPAEDRSVVEVNPLTDRELQGQLLRRNWFAAGSVMLRRGIVLAVGGYRDFSPAEDYDLWLRVAEVSQVGNLPDLLYTWFDRSSTTTRQNFALQEHMAREAVRAAVRRRSGRADSKGLRLDWAMARANFGSAGLKRRQAQWTMAALRAYGMTRPERARAAATIGARMLVP